MEFTFPDSKKTVQIEGVSFLTLSLVRGSFDKNYPGKPVEPVDPLEASSDGNVNSPEFKEKYEAYKQAKEQFTKDNALWQIKVNQAKWAAVKLYYAAHVKESSVDHNAVVDAEAQAKPFIDLRGEILDGYQELGIYFDTDLMERYIYLFHVCITTTGDQTLFENDLMQGSGPTQEAVQQSLFRLRSPL